MKLKAPTHTDNSTEFESTRYHWLLELYTRLFDPDDLAESFGHVDTYKYFATNFLPDEKEEEFKSMLKEIENNLLNSIQLQVQLLNATSNKKPTRKISNKVSRDKKVT